MEKTVITYRKTSRMSMRIGIQGEVRVSAPFGTPEKEVMRFIEENKDWIEKARKKKFQQLVKKHEFFEQLPLKTNGDCENALNRLNAIIPALVEKHSKIMRVKPTGIQYKPLTSRWGACNIKTKQLDFSVYLLLLPDWCIEHVVVHELAHLIVPNHSSDFYAVMDRFFPRWHEAREETKRIFRMEVEE